MEKLFTFRQAVPDDVPEIIKFVDFWLTGGAKARGVRGGSHDCLIPPSQHRDYLRKYHVLLALDNGKLIGWAVMSKTKRLFHLLVAGDYRGKGIGETFLRTLNPEIVRSKTDQGTGDPTDWYIHQGYVPEPGPLQGRRQNIQVLTKQKTAGEL